MTICHPYSCFLILIIVVITWGFSRTTEANSDLIPLEIFSVAQGHRLADLAPDGRHVALLDFVNEQPAVLIFQINDNKASASGSFLFPYSQINQLVWVSPTKLLVNQTETPLEIDPESEIQRRLISIDIEERRATEVWSVGVNRLIANQPAGILRVLDWNSGDVLISMPPDGGFNPAVHVLNIFSGKSTQIEPSTPEITKWLIDWDGRVRLATGVNEEGKNIVWYRESTEPEWIDLSENKILAGGSFLPIALDKSGKSLYMKSALGKARKGVYEFDLGTGRIRRKIYEHPKYDIGPIFLANLDREIAGVAYIDDYFQIEYLSDSMKEVLGAINEQLSDARNVVMDWSLDNNILLVLSERAPFPARYFIFQVTGNSLIQLPVTGEEIYQYPLVLPERVTFFSRDGLEIPAYLTRPQPVTGQPSGAIVLPHGGPWVRDFITYNDWVQFFVNRGYVVLQPNFRGSSGYGTLFESRGYGQWGEAMQRDLDDAVLWLIEQEIADPDRVCIAGGSYGGYAALMASIKSADLFKCAIAFAPVTDLGKYADSFSRSPYRKSTEAMILGDNSNETIRANSPIYRSDDVEIPLLLIHGTSDIRVPIYHSREMAQALHTSNVAVTYLELEGESHFLNQPASRTEVFQAMEKHLLAIIGAGVSLLP